MYGGNNKKNSDLLNINIDRDYTPDIEADIALAQPGFTSLEGGTLVERKGIEVGNIFQLGYHYSTLMHDAEYTTEEGKRQKYYMGCYGIGVGRTLAAIVEAHHDDKGIIWPDNIAPYKVYLARLGIDEAVVAASDKLYDELVAAGVEVLYDDRDVRPGEKFADADLIGIPHRVVVSAKTVEQGKFEYKKRTSSESSMESAENIRNLLTT
jgi:prolyl-tRNA synthetase